MRGYMFALAVSAALAASPALAHGPQIQITNDNNQIVTRRLILDAPYSDSLTARKSVYVMPLLPFNNVWYSRPNNEIDPILHQPAFFSGPGLAYGYDQVDGGPQAFAASSVLSLGFTDGLKRWDGAAFSDAGATELKAFRGSNVHIASPPENFAVTSDGPPFDSLSLPPVSATYNAEVHNSIRYGLLGDGSSPTSASPDGVYLVSFQLTSTQIGLAPSNAFFFVLHKNAPAATLAEAMNSLGFASSFVQWVPEPGSATLLMAGGTCLLSVRRRRLPTRGRG
ncbi:MAG: PEP-CTERM sorting domain-containing protein [Gemmataceae bacterium]|nr:PEP-CTERM sorting domain-containing protein [Gemmataceae bacterium]